MHIFLQNLEVQEGNLVPIQEPQPWNMPKGPTVMEMNLEGYMLACEILKQNTMEEERGMRL
jgi:hypothetical protein